MKRKIVVSVLTSIACVCAILGVGIFSWFATISYKENAVTELDYKVNYKRSINKAFHEDQTKIYKFDSRDQFEEKIAWTNVYGEDFFESNSLIIVDAKGTEYNWSCVENVYKKGNKVVINVSKTRSNIIERNVPDEIIIDNFNVRSALDMFANMPGEDGFVYYIEVDKESVQNVDSIEIEVVYSKTLYTTDEAVNAGFITEEDATNIWYYFREECAKVGIDINDLQFEEVFPLASKLPDEDFVPTPKSPAKLDERVKKDIERAYRDNIYDYFEEGFRSVFEKAEIVYLGTYNGYAAVCLKYKEPFKELLKGIPLSSPIVEQDLLSFAILCRVD